MTHHMRSPTLILHLPFFHAQTPRAKTFLHEKLGHGILGRARGESILGRWNSRVSYFGLNQIRFSLT